MRVALLAILLLACAAGAQEKPDPEAARLEALRESLAKTPTGLLRLGRTKEAIEKLSGAKDAAGKALLAEAHLACGQDAEALRLLEAALRDAPDSPELLLVHGKALVRAGRHGPAAAAFRSAMERDSPASLDARLTLCLLLDRLGRRRACEETAGPFFDLYAGTEDDRFDAPTALAIGSAATLIDTTENFKQGLKLVARAQKADPGFVEAYVRAGEIFAAKYQYEDAKREFESALRLHPADPEANVGLAGVLAFQREFAEVEACAGKALASDPRHAGALLLRAELEFIDERPAEALEAADRVLAICPDQPEARLFQIAVAAVTGRKDLDRAARESLLAAASSIPFGDDEEREETSRIVSARADLAAAEALSDCHRIVEALPLLERAVGSDPDNAAATAALGVCLMRHGREDDAEPVLRQAFELDRFNVWVFNLRKILDRRREYRAFKTERFDLSLHERDASVLAGYVRARVDRQLAACESMFDARVAGRVRLDFLRSHADFSARVTGLPRLDATGATFGPFVALVSPRAMRDRGRTYDWSATMHHELAHVVTLTASSYRVPRWLGEGLSVHAEGWIEPEYDIPLATLLDSGELPRLATWNRSFHRPKRTWEIPASYAAAGLFVGWLVEAHGRETLGKLLRHYGEGKSTAEAFREATGRSLEELDAWLHAKLRDTGRTLQARVLADPEELEALEKAITAKTADPAQTLRLLRLYAMFGEPKAKAAAAIAKETIAAAGTTPPPAGPAHDLLRLACAHAAETALTENKAPEAEAALNLGLRCAPDDARLLHLRALVEEKAGKTAEADASCRAAIARYPRFVERGAHGNPYLSLVRLHREKAPDKAVEALRAYVAIERNDAEALRELIRLAKAKRAGEALAAAEALTGVDPYEAADHLVFAELLESAGRKDEAAAEREIAKACPVAAPAPAPENAATEKREEPK